MQYKQTRKQNANAYPCFSLFRAAQVGGKLKMCLKWELTKQKQLCTIARMIRNDKKSTDNNTNMCTCINLLIKHTHST